VAEETDEMMPEMPTDFVTSTPQGNTLTVYNFQQMQILSSPVALEGMVPSSWIFEGIFPITLRTDRGDTIAEGYGSADIFDDNGEMREGLVPFTANFEFTMPDTEFDTAVINFSADQTAVEEGQDHDTVDIQVLLPWSE
jgi:hypothetical protein